MSTKYKIPKTLKLREIRREKGISLDLLAFYSHVPPRKIGLNERGLLTNFSLADKQRIASSLEMPVNAVFSTEETE